MAELAEEEDGDAAARQSEQRPRACYKHERAIPVQQTVEALDVREEGEERETGPRPRPVETPRSIRASSLSRRC